MDAMTQLSDNLSDLSDHSDQLSNDPSDLSTDIPRQFGKTMMPWNQRMAPSEDQKGQAAHAGENDPLDAHTLDVVKPIASALNQMEVNLSRRRFSPAFPERCAILRAALDGINTLGLPRSVAAPIYCNDMGIRHFIDARAFYLEHVRMAGLMPLDSHVIQSAIEAVDLPHLASFVDAFLLFFGDYTPIVEGLAARANEISQSGSLELLTISATVIGEASDRRALPLFEALEKRSPDAASKYFAVHRKAAFLSKRLHEAQQALDELNRAKDTYLTPLSQTLSADDKTPQDAPVHAALALFYNLRALPLIMLKRTADSQSDMSTALSEGLKALHELDPQSPAFLQVSRFSSQIAINLTQMAVEGTAPEGTDPHKAVQIMTGQLGFIAQNAPDFSSESLAEVAIALYHAGEYEKAVHYAVQALTALRDNGFLTGTMECRRVLAASLSQLGRKQQAAAIAGEMKTDPLGLLVHTAGDLLSD
jgi:tetratricopeptide (TPR) repeat protein